MADIRCPMCGKYNPAEADTCQYCQARLTPLIPNNQAPAPEEPFSLDSLFSKTDEDEGETDWLSSLRSDSTPVPEPTAPGADNSPAVPTAPPPEVDKKDDSPEWLNRIRQKQTEDDTGPLIPAPTDDGTPDWIKRIKEVPAENGMDSATHDDLPVPFPQQAGPEPQTAPPASADVDDDDQEWIRKMADWQNLPDDTPRMEPESPDESEFSLPNVSWLDEPVEPVSGELEAPAPGNEPVLPDWLRNEASAGLDSDENPASNPALPAWLKAAGAQADTPPGEPAPEGILPPTPDSEAAPSSGDNSSFNADWAIPSAFLGEDAGPAAAEVSPESPPDDTTWMEAIKSATSPSKDISTTPPTAGQTPQENTPASEALPDWLTGGNDNTSMDWSIPAAFSGDDAGQGTVEVSPDAPTGDTSWMEAIKSASSPAKDVSVPPESGQPPVAAGPAAPGSEAMPDWLTGGNDNTSMDWALPAAFSGDDAGQGAVEVSPTAPTADYSWLEAIQEPDTTTAENSSPAASASPIEQGDEAAQITAPMPFSSKDLPDWLGESDFEVLEPSAPAQPAEPAPILPFKEDSLDWLKAQPEEPAAQPQPQDQGKKPGSSPDLQPAQLPGWLQAMRPVESIGINATAATAAMQEDDSRVEKAGPLAGLRATLPMDSQAAQYRKPPIYSNTLHISEKQGVHATLLESLMSDSGRSHVSGKKARKPSAMPRLIIGLMMVVLVAAFLYMSGEDPTPATPPGMPGSDATLFANSIETLPKNANVIFAVDYQPGYDGELRTASLALLQRLVEKNINIILISTNPSGPAIGEDLLLNQPYKEFKAVNLGYLPGGITSLQQFAVDPRSAAPAGYRESANVLYYVGLMDKLAIYPVWLTDSMKNVMSIKDNVAAVVVATDSIDVGRAWVEQVKPLAGNSQLLFIASAQAAPLLRPYVLSRQAAGMLTGLNDGLAYQKYLQQPTKGHPGITNAMDIGVVFTILLVLSGAGVQLVFALLRQTQRKSKGVS